MKAPWKPWSLMNKLKNCFVQSPAYDSDQAKMYKLNSLLQGPAEDWNSPHLERPELYHFLNSWASLKTHFLETFSIVDRQWLQEKLYFANSS
jgi:hypothetical protein